MASVLKGANVTAQWYQDTYLGLLFAYLEKACLHTTETKGWPAYSGGASAPNATYHPLLRQIRQHFENNRSARALRDPSSTPVRENRDRVWQMEIICYSDYALARSVGGLWVGDLTDAHFTDIAWMLIQLNKDLGLPLTSQIRWAEGQKTYVSGRRLSSAGWDTCRGIATHFAVSGNSHWDAGGFFYSRLAAKIVQLLGTGEDDMTPEEAKNAAYAALGDPDQGVTLQWDGLEYSVLQALSFNHFMLADLTFDGNVPDTSTRPGRAGTPTIRKALQGKLDAALGSGALTPDQFAELKASLDAVVAAAVGSLPPSRVDITVNGEPVPPGEG